MEENIMKNRLNSVANSMKGQDEPSSRQTQLNLSTKSFTNMKEPTRKQSSPFLNPSKEEIDSRKMLDKNLSSKNIHCNISSDGSVQNFSNNTPRKTSQRSSNVNATMNISQDKIDGITEHIKYNLDNPWKSAQELELEEDNIGLVVDELNLSKVMNIEDQDFSDMSMDSDEMVELDMSEINESIMISNNLNHNKLEIPNNIGQSNSIVIRQNQKPISCYHYQSYFNLMCQNRNPQSNLKFKNLQAQVSDAIKNRIVQNNNILINENEFENFNIQEQFVKKGISKINLYKNLNFGFFNDFSFHAFIRHSERADQAGEFERVRVKCDSQLSIHGQQIALDKAKKISIKLARFLSFGFKIIFHCSPYLRCLETAFIQQNQLVKIYPQIKDITKIQVNVKLRENYNLLTYKAYDLKDLQAQNVFPQEKLILQNQDHSEYFNQIVDEYGIDRDILFQPSLEEINHMEDKHMLIEDAMESVKRHMHILETISGYEKKTINLQFTHKNTLSTVANLIKNEFYFKPKQYCDTDFQAQNESFLTSNRFMEKLQKDYWIN